MERNPWSLGQSWYPEDGELCYHTVFGDAFRGFASIWEEGMLLSASERTDRFEGDVESKFDPVDEYAGDGAYVFMSLGKPIMFEKDTGYLFVVNALELLEGEDGVIVGEKDVQLEYIQLKNEVVDRFQTAMEDDPDLEDFYFGIDYENWHTFSEAVSEYEGEVERVQEQYRLSGFEAKAWVRQFAAKDHVGRQYHTLPEILVPEALDVSWCVAFIFDRIFFTSDDFISLVGVDPGEPLPVAEAGATRYRGFPYRCPICGDPLVEGATLKDVIEQNPWRRVKERGIEGARPVLYCASHEGYIAEDSKGEMVSVDIEMYYGPMYEQAQ
jgi:hypothetical protein